MARIRAVTAFDILDELYELAENKQLVGDERARRTIKSCARSLELHVRDAGRLFIQEESDQVRSSNEGITNTQKAEMERHKTEVLSALSTKLDGFMTQVKQEVQKLSDSAKMEQNQRFAKLLSEIKKESPPKEPTPPSPRILKRKRQETDAQTATKKASHPVVKKETL